MNAFDDIRDWLADYYLLLAGLTPFVHIQTATIQSKTALTILSVANRRQYERLSVPR